MAQEREYSFEVLRIIIVHQVIVTQEYDFDAT